MTYGGGTHGPRQDEALKRETRSEVQAGRATRTEEWREPEPPGEDQPDATWAPQGRPGGTPPEQDVPSVQLRSDLARHLDRTAFPADREHLVATLSTHHAPQALVDLVSSLPAGASYASVGEVARALGLPVEQHRT